MKNSYIAFKASQPQHTTKNTFVVQWCVACLRCLPFLHRSWRKPNSCRALVRQVAALHSLHPNKQKQAITDRQSGTKALWEECRDTFQRLKKGQFTDCIPAMQVEIWGRETASRRAAKELHGNNSWLDLDLKCETTNQRQSKSESLSQKMCKAFTRSHQIPGTKDWNTLNQILKLTTFG